MRKKRACLVLFLFIFITLKLSSPICIYGADEPKPIRIKILQPHEYPIITTSGRLTLEKPGKVDRLIFHSKEANAYVIKGELTEKLKALLLDLGEDNLVTLTGKQDGSYNVSCRNTYHFDAEGNQKIETRCIRYYNLEVTKIIETKKSDEEIPPPKRDIEEERKARISLRQTRGLILRGEIEGKISSLNLRSPIKTMEVTYRDKDNKLINKVFFLTSNTRIAKKGLDTEEPMYLSINSLRVNQEITLIYARDERKSEVLFITITKE